MPYEWPLASTACSASPSYINSGIIKPMKGGVVIKAARLRAGLTQRELSVRAGTTQNAISRWERGLIDPGLATVAEIVRACGFELHCVLAEPDRQAAATHAVAEHLSPRERLAVSAGWSALRDAAQVVV